MKKVLFLLALCLLVVGLKAQSTDSSQQYLLGLWYGDSYDDCVELLAEKGFEYSHQISGGGEVYTPGGSVELGLAIEKVVIYFENDEDELTSWLVGFERSIDYDVKLKVTTLFKQLHGDYVYSKDVDIYSWDFDDTHFLEARFNDGNDLFYAAFATVM